MLTAAVVGVMGGKLKDYPDYEDSEEEYDPEWIEAQLSRHPWVRRMPGGAPDVAPVPEAG